MFVRELPSSLAFLRLSWQHGLLKRSAGDKEARVGDGRNERRARAGRDHFFLNNLLKYPPEKRSRTTGNEAGQREVTAPYVFDAFLLAFLLRHSLVMIVFLLFAPIKTVVTLNIDY